MIKKIASISIVAILIGLLFLGFMYFIGIPKTQARNFYNLAIQAEESGDKAKEVDYLKTAISFWPEVYIVQKLQSLQN